MAKIIAVAGKGGVGKTTLTGLMIQYLCKNGKTPILAVDADANSNLNEVLGVEAPPTLGEIRRKSNGQEWHKILPSLQAWPRATTCKCGWGMPLQRKRILT